jgi:alpha-mannosidase
LVNLDGHVLLSAVKLAEDGDAVIVRFYEPYGRSATVAVRLDAMVSGVERSNGLEDPGTSLPVDEHGRVSLTVRAFEVVTLRFCLS